MNINALNGVLLADFTIDPLAARLSNGNEFPAAPCEVAPFDQVLPILMNPSHPVWQEKNFAVIWSRPERVSPAFQAILNLESPRTESIVGDVDAYCDLILATAGRVEATFVPTFTMPSFHRGLGALSTRPALGAAYWLNAMNSRLMERLSSAANVFVLDANQWVQTIGTAASNPKLWLMGKLLFPPELLRLAASDVKSTIRALCGLSKKLLILDLDETMWGGIVGEVGWQGVSLGGHDAFGESFVDFQKSIKALTRTGVILGIVSKNDESVALEAIESHPDMVLRKSDFAGWRINWRDKATNIAELVEELNLGLDAAVFIDDNPAERARVRESLPNVFVPEWPEDKLLYSKALKELRCFDRVSITKEDLSRTEMYVAERQRNETRSSALSMDDWLASLELKLQVELLNEGNIKRATQLLNKTNQMNLKTRRFTEEEFIHWAELPGNAVYCFRVLDRFGDYGLTGIASISANGDAGIIEDFLLSCRVMGRGVERGMLHVVLNALSQSGVLKTTVQFIKTDRNKPMLDYLVTESELMASQDSGVFEWNHSKAYEIPVHVSLELDDDVRLQMGSLTSPVAQ